MTVVNLPHTFGCGEKNKNKKNPEVYHNILDEFSYDVSSCFSDFKNFRLCFSLMDLGNVCTSEYTRI